jgi:GNAT superfamily N-acetyltransferase
MPPPLEIRPLRPTDWPFIEELFGPNGACGGCWCMYWRVPTTRDFRALKGPAARKAFHDLVTSGRAHGLLAFEEGRPVGWCALGPRSDFPLTETKRSYVPPDDAAVYSANCFFIRKDRRSKGIAGKLLAAAVDEARAASAPALEGYPSVPKAGTQQAAAFLYKGTLSMFTRAGFRVVSRRYPGSPLVRLALAPRARKKPTLSTK